MSGFNSGNGWGNPSYASRHSGRTFTHHHKTDKPTHEDGSADEHVPVRAVTMDENDDD